MEAVMVKESMENQRDSKGREYVEKNIPFSGDPYSLAVHLIELSGDQEYALYENGGELSVGLGEYGRVEVYANYSTLHIDDLHSSYDDDDLARRIQSSFSDVPLVGWRAYGFTYFNMARHLYQLLLAADECLMKLIIPQQEVRINAGNILLRALEIEELEKLAEKTNAILQNLNDQDKAAKRANTPRLAFDIINTYDKEKYVEIVSKAVAEIKNQQYEKVILSRKIPLNCQLDMPSCYLAGRKVNTPARSFLVKLDGLEVVGFSPETIAETDSTGWVSTMPLAGTRSMSGNQEEDQRLRNELLRDPKEIAEHAVSVKLAFEELEQVCQPTSVVVNEFMNVSCRGTVQHLASRLQGQIHPEKNIWSAFLKLFPAVTASGIPKRQAIEAIGRLEVEGRDLYSGAVMTVDSDGNLDAALVLRTIFQQDGRSWLQTGAGVVEMSQPAREFEETCEKLRSYAQQLIPQSDK